MLAFRSMVLPIGKVSKSMTQVSMEMMAGRGQGMPERVDVRDALDRSCLRPSKFSNPASEFSSTYHSGSIDKDSESGVKKLV